jgi:tryptophan-rich sensory protein
MTASTTTRTTTTTPPPDTRGGEGRRGGRGLLRLGLYVGAFVGSAVALNGWIFSGGAIAWSSTLRNPPWSPPGPVTGAIWVTLFALMAGALFVVERNGRGPARNPARGGILVLWLVNMTWTWAYFGLRNVPNGFYVTVLAWVICVPVLGLAWRATRLGGALLMPLLGWLTFALALSWTTWQLNPR